MTSVLDYLVEHDMSDDCPVCRAQEVVAIALMPAAAAWEADNGLPRFAVALNGAAELLGALLQDGLAREATEIQNIQIADGAVCYGWPIPIHMVFPRLFTAPTVTSRTFQVEFEVNLVILFTDGHLLTENFPIKLVRV